MEPQATLRQQYAMVQQSREVLLQYCDTITTADFCMENSSFGRGSMRNLLVHVGNTYELWLGKRALRREASLTAPEAIGNVEACRSFFQSVDALVAAFLDAFSQDYLSEIKLSINNTPAQASPLKLFTHVVTHEYHHKGQVLSLSRHLGYTPVDTDIMR
ncbi:DinB family protein [Pontibacter actiniarum]|uniref:Damage-inducible protein DinB n=1 Tax=Pontibacter actiniarum TaxID=323450 RepID=A0A1X9YUJ7_9BACT|nr:DinB family protein [Pontibacter actiniarum]ARS36576.1 damage-inducible protein DinB [Pontibacter actiniarum]